MSAPGRICIGNQTAASAASLMEPFYYAIQNGFDAFERHDPLIINNCSMRSEGYEFGFISFIAITNFSNGTDGYLGREAELFSYLLIDNLLKFELVC